MKRPARYALLCPLVSFSVIPAAAATKTITLAVPGMTCAASPLTVKQALAKVNGVEKAQVSFEKKEAVVICNDAKTSVEKLNEATKNAGYRSTVKK